MEQTSIILCAEMPQRKMYGRKKVRVVQPEHDQELCQRAEEAGESIRQRNAIWKDFHLVEAARATDERIASMDETMRGLLSKAAIKKGVKELREIVWVNPNKAQEEAIRWLEDGAPHEQERCLGYQKSK